MGKIGRNEPCPCGKKYKKCCIDKETVKVSGEFDSMIRRGNELIFLDMDIEACDIWFPVWENLKQILLRKLNQLTDLIDNIVVRKVFIIGVKISK